MVKMHHKQKLKGLRNEKTEALTAYPETYRTFSPIQHRGKAPPSNSIVCQGDEKQNRAYPGKYFCINPCNPRAISFQPESANRRHQRFHI